jgi:hypothetical protein
LPLAVSPGVMLRLPLRLGPGRPRLPLLMPGPGPAKGASGQPVPLEGLSAGRALLSPRATSRSKRGVGMGEESGFVFREEPGAAGSVRRRRRRRRRSLRSHAFLQVARPAGGELGRKGAGAGGNGTVTVTERKKCTLPAEQL